MEERDIENQKAISDFMAHMYHLGDIRIVECVAHLNYAIPYHYFCFMKGDIEFHIEYYPAQYQQYVISVVPKGLKPTNTTHGFDDISMLIIYILQQVKENTKTEIT